MFIITLSLKVSGAICYAAIDDYYSLNSLPKSHFRELPLYKGFPGGSVVKNPSAKQEKWV